MVPLRGIFEALEMKVSWEAETKQITAQKSGLQIQLYLGSDIAYVNKKDVVIDAKAYVKEGRTWYL